ncbi:MAG: S1 RNA-binding domain-containing protein, partial [Oscillospiraceae bacterium]
MSEILENQNQEELSFEEMLDQSFKSTYNGEKVVGVVTGIAPNEIAVDIGTKHAGYVPLSELTDDPT